MKKNPQQIQQRNFLYLLSVCLSFALHRLDLGWKIIITGENVLQEILPLMGLKVINMIVIQTESGYKNNCKCGGIVEAA